MNKRITRIVCLVGIGIFLTSGCSTTATIPPQRNQAGDKVGYIPRQISHTEITIPSSGQSDLQKEIKDTIDYLEFQQSYNIEAEKIITALQQGKLNEAQTRIRALAAKLERSSNPYEKRQVHKVRNFSYIIYEANDVIEKKTRRHYLNPAAWYCAPLLFELTILHDVGMTPLNILFFRGEDKVELLTPKVIKNISQTESKIIGKTFDEVRIYPYSGRRETITKNIPYETLKRRLNLK